MRNDIPHSLRRRCVFSILLAWFCLTAIPSAQPQGSYYGGFQSKLVGASTAAASKEQAPATLNIAFSSSVFVDVNVADALAATKVWAATIVQKKGLEAQTETIIFNDLRNFTDDAKRKSIDMVVLLTQEYLDIAGSIEMDPHFVPIKRGRVGEEILLLVHRQSGIQGLEGLKGKDLILLTGARAGFGRLWLERLFFERRITELDSYFKKITTTTRNSKAVLPVYFRQADSCIVTRDGFETMFELNPQLRADLQTLAISPPLLATVIAVRGDYRSDLKEALIDSLEKLHEEPKGQQILTLFKIDRLVPFKASYLDTAKELLTAHRRLGGQARGGDVGSQ